MPSVRFLLNGRQTEVTYDEGMLLLEILREQCGIVSVKDGCAPQGYCGCCTVMIDGKPELSCLMKPERVAGKTITTLEGIETGHRDALAASFGREGAVQCGFCTPGIAMRAKSLIDAGKATDDEAIEEALGHHFCRCTGYLRVKDAIKTAGEVCCEGKAQPARPRREDYFGAKFGVDGRAPMDAGKSKDAGIGAAQPRYRADDMVCGKKAYVADMRLPGMLHGAFVLSRHPRAKVLSVKTEKALGMTGVVRVLGAGDVPGKRVIGHLIKDWPVFVAVGEETRCVGDVIAFVVADTQFRARQAAKAVEVEYEVLSPLIDPEEAMKPTAHKIHPKGNLLETCAYSRGDVEKALASSAHVMKHRFTTQRIEHAFLECEAALAIPTDAGGIFVYSQSQGVHEDQHQIAEMLGLPNDKVMVELASNGGGFGGKEDLSVQGQTALAAWLLKKPVRAVLTREQSLALHPKRHPLTMEYEVGADKDGHLTAVKVRIVGDTGAYASVGTKVLERAAGHACGPYRVPNVQVEAHTVYTNNPISGAMRGFGVNQTSWAIETMLNMISEKTGIDGWDLREKNILNPGDRFATGQVMTESCLGLRKSLEAVKDVYRKGRFAGIACGVKNTGIGNGLHDTGRVLIRVGREGKIEILTGFTEMGQGLFTILRQVVAHETGLPLESMSVKTVSEEKTRCGMTTASRATALATMAAQRAAQKLAGALSGKSLEKLAGEEFQGDYICTFTVKPGTKTDNPVTHLTFSWATQVVLLDDTGKIEKVVVAQDVGRAINALSCVTQIEGAVHMGLGQALSENFPSTGGVPDSYRLRDIGFIPAREMPPVDVILIEVPDPVGGYGAKGVGEIGLVPTAGAVAGALRKFDKTWRFALPMQESSAARDMLPKSRKLNK